MKADVLIVGAGFAGAATAFHLSRVFEGRILLVDKEPRAGVHASGKNASLVLQPSSDRLVAELISRSREVYSQLFDPSTFRQQGSLLLGRTEELEAVRHPEWFESEWLSPEEVRRRISLLAGHPFDAALWTPSDGVMDIQALLEFYLREAQLRNLEIRYGVQVKEAERSQGIFRVRTDQESIETPVLVNAAGAWAGQLGERCGASPLPLQSLKRHLFVLDCPQPIDPQWPFVWNFTRDFYFRPEAGGLLFSICDEEPAASLEPSIDPEATASLSDLIWDQLPALRDALQREVWACFRTRTTDPHCVIGWDPRLEGFFWVAALWGHGMSTSWEVGRLAAEALLAGEKISAGPFSPARLSPAVPIR